MTTDRTLIQIAATYSVEDAEWQYIATFRDAPCEVGALTDAPQYGADPSVIAALEELAPSYPEGEGEGVILLGSGDAPFIWAPLP